MPCNVLPNYKRNLSKHMGKKGNFLLFMLIHMEEGWVFWGCLFCLGLIIFQGIRLSDNASVIFFFLWERKRRQD